MTIGKNLIGAGLLGVAFATSQAHLISLGRAGGARDSDAGGFTGSYDMTPAAPAPGFFGNVDSVGDKALRFFSQNTPVEPGDCRVDGLDGQDLLDAD